MPNNNQLHVVFGANGGLGKTVVRELLRQGKHVRAVTRSGKSEDGSNAEQFKADALNATSAKQACSEAAVVYHCINVLYTKWHEQLPQITENLIEGAAAANAKLIVGDNLYMYGPPDGPMTEDLPNTATGQKGQLRAELSERLLAAHRQGKVRVAIGRASDFFGPGIVNSSAGERVFVPALKGGRILLIGNLDVPRTWSNIDDVARGMAVLGEREEALGQVWHLPSAEPVTTREFLNLVFAETGRRVPVWTVGRVILSVMGLFDPMMREIKEIVYQFERPWVMDHGKFARAFGAQVTPLPEAIHLTADWFRAREVMNA